VLHDSVTHRAADSATPHARDSVFETPGSSVTASPAPRPPAGVHDDSLFYALFGAVIAAIVFVGFAPTYYLRPAASIGALSWPLHLHGFVFTAWIALLCGQALLIRQRRFAWHRRLGWAGAGLAVLVTTTGAAVGLMTARREAAFVAAEEVRAFLTIPFFSMAAFAALAAAAMLYRRRPEAHKRLMLLATISLLDAPIARWPGAPGPAGVFLLVDLFIIAGVVHDLATRRRVHPAYAAGGALVVASQLLREVLGRTAAWQAVAAALIG
jgi:hypothetical protein